MRRSRDLSVLALLTLVLHLPFIARPAHNDEVNYLDIAANVFLHPATPLNFQFVFMGAPRDAAGHPHPPLNAYLLAALWAERGHVSMVFFHAIYLVFPLTIAFAAYWIAARFTKYPLWVAMLVIAAPAVQVSGNSIETDTPALAFLLAGAAFFLARRFIPAAILFTLAAFTALQTLPVIALLLLFGGESGDVAAWTAAVAPFVALGAWQAAQYAIVGRLPAEKLAGYMAFPAFSTFEIKRNSIIMLTEHLGAMVVFAPMRVRWRNWIPALLPAAATLLIARDYAWWERAVLFACVALGAVTLLWIANRLREQRLLALWCLGYFAFACVAFFAGAARYLMPIALPLAILFVLQNEQRKWRLAATLAISLFIGMNLSFADYELARLYADIPAPPGRFLVNGEWGFRYSLTRHGGEMIQTTSAAKPGQWIVKSDLAVGANYGSPAESLAVGVTEDTRELISRTPFRVIDRYAHSGFETVGAGLLPFSFSRRPIDRITYGLDSPFLDVRQWLPTRIDDHLVFLATSGDDVHVAANPAWHTCRATLFARGQGSATFVAAPFFARTVDVNGDYRAPVEFHPSGLRELIFRADGPRTGWEELICY